MQLRGAQRGSTAYACQRLLKVLSCTIGVLEEALQVTAAAALDAGVGLEGCGRLAGLSYDALAEALTAERDRLDKGGR